MPKQNTSVWRVYRIQGPKAIVIKTLKAADADSAVKRVVDDLKISDPAEQERFFARLDD
jgi:hypothetical protein